MEKEREPGFDERWVGRFLDEVGVGYDYMNTRQYTLSMYVHYTLHLSYPLTFHTPCRASNAHFLRLISRPLSSRRTNQPTLQRRTSVGMVMDWREMCGRTVGGQLGGRGTYASSSLHYLIRFTRPRPNN
jgi:hypothetical protein